MVTQVTQCYTGPWLNYVLLLLPQVGPSVVKDVLLGLVLLNLVIRATAAC